MALKAFKEYDVRGHVGEDIDESLAYRLGRAFAQIKTPENVVLGRDIRESSPMLLEALASGLLAEGVNVLDIELCGTEEVYFAADHLGADGGVMVTASHNPAAGDNGFKIVGRGAHPINRSNGLLEMEALIEADRLGPPKGTRGSLRKSNPRAAYVERLMSFVDTNTFRPMKVLTNAGNGAAGPTLDAIIDALSDAPVGFVRMHHNPDSGFPNGVPNPLLPENQPVTANATMANDVDLGIAWDGDFDRCFFFDETGSFVGGEYIVGLLASTILAKSPPGSRVVHDPRIIWNTLRIIEAAGGEAVVSRTGHALVKEAMRKVDAVYGGEMSGHHYFRDFMYCDSGMIPWLLVLDHMSATGQALSELVRDMRSQHPSSGERTFRLSNADAATAAIEAEFTRGGTIDRLDGLSVEFEHWRFNLRKSKTEAGVRLNVESRADPELLSEKIEAISARLNDFA